MINTKSAFSSQRSNFLISYSYHTPDNFSSPEDRGIVYAASTVDEQNRLDTLLLAAQAAAALSPTTNSTCGLFGDNEEILANLNFWRQKYYCPSSEDEEEEEGDDDDEDEEDSSSDSDTEYDYPDRETILVIRGNRVQYTILQQASTNDSNASTPLNDTCTVSPMTNTENSGEEEVEEVVKADRGKRPKSFEERYQQLKDYFAVHGHANVIATRGSELESLGRFLANQRSRYRSGELDSNRPALYRALNITGFEKDHKSPAFSAKKKASKGSSTKKAASNGASSKKAAPKSRVASLAPQKRGRLPKASDLTEILVLSPPKNKLKATPSEQGIRRSPRSALADTSNSKRLGRGCRPQYYIPEDYTSPAKKSNKATPKSSPHNTPTPKTKKRASASSNSMESSSSKKKKKSQATTKTGGRRATYFSWEERMDQLREYKARNGHLNIPVSKTHPDGELGQFLSSKRSQHKKGIAKPEHVKDLRRMGCRGF